MRASLKFGERCHRQAREKFDFPDFDELQRLVMPVVSVENGILRCWRSAVRIGAGWFVTARHVLENLDTAGATDVFIVGETDTPLPTVGADYLGSLLAAGRRLRLPGRYLRQRTISGGSFGVGVLTIRNPCRGITWQHMSY